MATETRQIVLESPTGAAPGVGLWIAALEDGRRRTLEMLERVTPELVDAEAPYHQHTIGTLLYHVALIEADWLYVEIREESYPDDLGELLPFSSRDERGSLTSVTGVSLEVHLDRLAEIRKRLRSTLLGLSESEFSEAREIPDAVVSTAWVIHHLIQHEAEHRGEIGQILDAHESGGESQ